LDARVQDQGPEDSQEPIQVWRQPPGKSLKSRQFATIRSSRKIRNALFTARFVSPSVSVVYEWLTVCCFGRSTLWPAGSTDSLKGTLPCCASADGLNGTTLTSFARRLIRNAAPSPSILPRSASLTARP